MKIRYKNLELPFTSYIIGEDYIMFFAFDEAIFGINMMNGRNQDFDLIKNFFDLSEQIEEAIKTKQINKTYDLLYEIPSLEKCREIIVDTKDAAEMANKFFSSGNDDIIDIVVHYGLMNALEFKRKIENYKPQYFIYGDFDTQCILISLSKEDLKYGIQDGDNNNKKDYEKFITINSHIEIYEKLNKGYEAEFGAGFGIMRTNINQTFDEFKKEFFRKLESDKYYFYDEEQALKVYKDSKSVIKSFFRKLKA